MGGTVARPWDRCLAADLGLPSWRVNLNEMDDNDLVRQVLSNEGAAGRGAAAELTRRLMVQLRASARVTAIQGWCLIALTVALLALTIVLAVR